MKNIIIFISLIFVSVNGIAQIHIGQGQSFLTIEAAHIASVIHPGDTVYLHVGIFAGYQGILALKGDSLNWIVITRYQEDSIEIRGGWQFMSCEFIKFLNLNFKANEQYPGRLLNLDNSGSCETQSRFIKFDSCSFSDVTDPNAITAFKFGGVDNFEITNCIYQNMPSCGAFDFNVCHNGLIRGNRIENCLTGGHIKGGASNITMDRNIFINASAAPWVAFEFGGDTGDQFYCPGDNFEVKNLNFYSNIIIGGYRGLALSSAVDCNVINNTFYNCGQAVIRFLTTSHLYPDLSGNRIHNNIFAFGESAYINGGSQLADAATISNNIYYSFINPSFTGPYWDTPELDAIRETNPMIFGSDELMFVNAEENDFHLIEGSPAITSALTVSEPSTDFYGNIFLASSRSCGAIEYIPETGIDEKTKGGNICIYPNPASDYINIKLVPQQTICPWNIKIINELGIVVCEVQLSYPDTREIWIDTIHLSAGLYLCIFRAGGYFETVKMVVVR
ncbi:T9SS type A sorting domain-containing protein [Bacteroidota bacterium]